MNRLEVLEYYAREDVVKELVKNAAYREVAGAHIDGKYDARPNIVQFPSDIMQMAKKGVVSFHYSVEHWANPMALGKNSGNYQSLRTGWDLLLDIDSKLGIEEAQLTAAMIAKFIEKYNVKNYGVKFSGRRGFHIIMPWIMFPKQVNFRQTKELYPEIPRIVSRFICERISQDLMQSLIRLKGMKGLLSVLDSPPSEISPYYFVEVERNWGNRHMFRAPYSLNEKTWLASVPIARNELASFRKEDASPDKVTIKPFFAGEENEAESLLLDALDWHSSLQKEPEKKKDEKKRSYENKIPEELFPPCIKLIFAGIKDGRKRSIFTLINFLRMCNWNWQEIEARLMEWNKIVPLPQNTIMIQIRWAQQNARTAPNCDNVHYFQDIGICQPDATCKGGTSLITVKNPINYPFRKMDLRKEKAEPPKEVYSCSKCKKPFETMKGLTIHLSRSHGISE